MPPKAKMRPKASGSNPDRPPPETDKERRNTCVLQQYCVGILFVPSLSAMWRFWLCKYMYSELSMFVLDFEPSGALAVMTAPKFAP